MTCVMMTSLGVYVLGAAEQEERRRVEAHLPHCASCRADLLRLAPIPGLLAAVPAEAARRLSGDVAAAPDIAARSAGPPGVRSLSPGARTGELRGRRPRGRAPRGGWRRRGRVAGSLAGLAALVAAAGILITGGWGALSPGRPGGGTTPAVTLSGTSRASHVHATARLLTTSWGTRIRLTVRGVPLNVRCRLVVRSTAGGTETIGMWAAWREGPITVPASADWRPTDIASLAVMTGKRTLVTIRSPH